MFDLRFNPLIYLFLFLVVSSCMISTKQEKEIDPPITYKGWWVYGEGQHIFKDEATLGEWQLSFPNENFEELVELYLAVCEMEYFPMECEMHGNLINDTLIVEDFEILYIQGCGE
jgi:hypothetical protein